MTTLRLQFNTSDPIDKCMTEVLVNGEPWIEFVDDFDWQNDFNTGQDDPDEMDDITIIRAWLDHQANYLFEDTGDLKGLINIAMHIRTPKVVYTKHDVEVTKNLIECPGKWRIVIED